MRYSIYYFLTLTVLTTLFIRCGNDNVTIPEEKKTSAPSEIKVSEVEIHDFSVNVIEINDNQFGYDILMNGQPYIHQPHIPAVGGVKGFSSKEKAEVAGGFVVQKLNNNIMPPTISLEELDSLGVLN